MPMYVNVTYKADIFNRVVEQHLAKYQAGKHYELFAAIFCNGSFDVYHLFVSRV